MLWMYTVFWLNNSLTNRRNGRLLCWPRLKLNRRTTYALAQILSSRVCTLRHCNARGCECGRRETFMQCCSNAGPPSSMPASPWCLVAAYPVYVYSHWWQTVIHCLIFQIINLRVWALSLSNLYHYFQHWISFLVIFTTCPYDNNLKS